MASMIPFSRRLELWFLSSLPALITIVLTIFYLASKHIPGLDRFMPTLPMMPVFYWGMMHARDMPYWFVFALGLVLDAVTGQPLGLSSLLTMCFLFLLHAQRKYFHKEGFVIKWGYFAALLGATTLLGWLALSLFNERAEPLPAALMQWALTLCCYPLFHKGFDGIYNHVHARRWQILHGQ